jgi:hypothetical protein
VCRRAPERDDYFGAAVSILNLNGAYGLDATIGAPGEEVGGDDKGYASGSGDPPVRRQQGPRGRFRGRRPRARRSGQYYGYLAHQ